MPVASNTPSTGDVNSSSSSTEKNIWLAAGEGDLERVRHLVEVEHISPIAADQFTYTPLHAAASYGHIDILRFLLNHSSAPENAIETTDADGDTPLFTVEDVSVARTLIEEFGANAKHENQSGDTAAANAEENEWEEVAAYLRSVTGEEPMYQRTLTEQANLDPSANEAMDAAIDGQTDALMIRVQDILRRAEARGASSGEELNDEEEAELRRVVGESVLTQIREGWGVAGGEDEEALAILSSAVSMNGAEESADTSLSAQQSIPEEEEEEEPRPGR
ncbi:hypothetical protein L7F22_003025 [Adiantum nelumboides]|nr:hypothetical protein [Adiantum nelumboides]